MLWKSRISYPWKIKKCYTEGRLQDVFSAHSPRGIFAGLLVSTNNTVSIRVENFDTKNSHCEKLLRVKFNHKLTFNSHILDLKKLIKKFMH